VGLLPASISYVTAPFPSLPACTTLVFIARISYKSPLAWACQRQASAAHFSPLESYVLLLLPDCLTNRRAASRSSGSFSFSCFLSPILGCLNRPPSPLPTDRRSDIADLCFAVVDSLHALPSPQDFLLLPRSSRNSRIASALQRSMSSLTSSRTFGIAVSSLQEPPPDSLIGHPDQAYTAIQMKWTCMSVSPCEADRSSEWDSKFVWHLGFLSMNEAKYPLA